MSSMINHLKILYNNPFIFSYILYCFYKELPQKSNNLLLSYLVFPLSLYPASQTFLKNANKRSRLLNLTKKHERIYGLQERINDFKIITNMTLQYNIDREIFEFNNSLTINVLNELSNEYDFNNDASKAAEKLAKLVSAYDIQTTYRMLGVKQL